MRIVLATEAREGPNTQDKAERLMAETGHLFEEMVATIHPLGVAGGWQAKSSNVQAGLTRALEEKLCGTFPVRPQQCVHGGRDANTLWCSDTSYSSVEDVRLQGRTSGFVYFRQRERTHP